MSWMIQDESASSSPQVESDDASAPGRVALSAAEGLIGCCFTLSDICQLTRSVGVLRGMMEYGSLLQLVLVPLSSAHAIQYRALLSRLAQWRVLFQRLPDANSPLVLAARLILNQLRPRATHVCIRFWQRTPVFCSASARASRNLAPSPHSRPLDMWGAEAQLMNNSA